MRAVLQKVLEAKVVVGSKVVGSIGPGVCVLVGISTDDTLEDVEYMARKILNVRVFEDGNGNMWKKSVKDMNTEVLCISQFTLYGKTIKGYKPDFHTAMKADKSRQLFDKFVDRIKDLYEPSKIATGEFGAMMQVSLTNDGPVTLQLDSRKFTYDESDPVVAAQKALKEKRRQERLPTNK